MTARTGLELMVTAERTRHPRPPQIADDYISRWQRRRAHQLMIEPLYCLCLQAGRVTPGDRPALFAQACAMGLEGIVSKRRSSPYRSGRSLH